MLKYGMLGICALSLGLYACAEPIAGRICAIDNDCGAGFDCFKKRCRAVCGDDAACDLGHRCLQHRCLPQQDLMLGQKNPPKMPSAQKGAEIELRAIRRRLERIEVKLDRLLSPQQHPSRRQHSHPHPHPHP